MDSRRGIITALLAFVFWGFFPLYWKLLVAIPALEVLAHRIVWSTVVLVLIVTLQSRWDEIVRGIRDRNTLLRFIGSSVLIAINWLGFIWGVSNGYVIECSLGYFMLPLFNVTLGVVFLRERLRPAQMVAVAIAACGVAYAAFGYGSVPWVALTLAISFSFYALLRKTAPLGSLLGLALETMILVPPALAYLVWNEAAGVGAFMHEPLRIDILLILSGIVTAIPLLLYADAARRLKLSTLGVLNYLAPICQFSLGVFYYHEKFSTEHAVVFGAVWAALIIYTTEGLLVARRERVKVVQDPIT